MIARTLTALAQSDPSVRTLAVLGLLLFFAVFAGAAVWAWRPAGRDARDAAERLPFDSQENA